MTTNEVKELMAGTFLAEIVEIVEAGDFPEDGLDPIREGEVLLGEMTPLEKAFHFLAGQITKAAGGLKELDASIKNASLQLLIEKGELIGRLQWILIRERLGCTEVNSICIRQGWQVVRLPKEKECGCLPCQLKRQLLGGLDDGIAVIEVVSGTGRSLFFPFS